MIAGKAFSRMSEFGRSIPYLPCNIRRGTTKLALNDMFFYKAGANRNLVLEGRQTT